MKVKQYAKTNKRKKKIEGKRNNKDGNESEIIKK